jgi:hypothetical protein
LIAIDGIAGLVVFTLVTTDLFLLVATCL